MNLEHVPYFDSSKKDLEITESFWGADVESLLPSVTKVLEKDIKTLERMLGALEAGQKDVADRLSTGYKNPHVPAENLRSKSRDVSEEILQEIQLMLLSKSLDSQDGEQLARSVQEYSETMCHLFEDAMMVKSSGGNDSLAELGAIIDEMKEKKGFIESRLERKVFSEN